MKPLLLVIFELLRLLVKTMTAVDKYSLGNIWKFVDLIQMELSKKVKIFHWIFSPILKSASSFRHFQTKPDSHGPCISENTGCQRYV